MCNLKSPSLNANEVSVQCLQTAMHEWSFYDRDFFNEKQKMVLELIKRSELPINENTTPSIEVFTRSFEVREAQWMEQYGVNYVGDYTPLISESSAESDSLMFSEHLTSGIIRVTEAETDDESGEWNPHSDIELYKNLCAVSYDMVSFAYLTPSILQYLKMFVYVGPSLPFLSGNVADELQFKHAKFDALWNSVMPAVPLFTYSSIARAIVVETSLFRCPPLPFQYFLYVAWCLSCLPIARDLHWTVFNMLSLSDLPCMLDLDDGTHFIRHV
jgi:hypothetical protein